MTPSEDVIRRWKDFERFSISLQGIAHIKSVFSNGKTRIQTYRWKQNHECALGCQISTDFPYESITLKNPTYKAKLRRDLSDRSRVALSSLESLNRGDQSLSRTGNFSLYYSVGAHFAYWELPLSELVAKPASFQIKEMAKIMEGGKELVRINHRSLMDDHEHKTRFQRQGVIYLDPSRCWCIRKIRETEVIYNDGVLHRTAEWDIRFETIDHPSGFPLLQKETTNYDGLYERDKRKVVGTINSEYEWEVNDHVPTSEFTLSAFGLPEPVFTKQTTYPIVRSPTSEISIVVEGADRVFTDLVPQRDYNYSFRIRNRTGRTLRVIGAELT